MEYLISESHYNAELSTATVVTHTVSEVVQCRSTIAREACVAGGTLKEAATKTVHRPYYWTSTKRHRASHGVKVVVHDDKHVVSGQR